MTSRVFAKSVKVRVIGPAVSRLEYKPIMPARDTSPQLGRKPVSALLEDGLRIDPHVSEPKPTTP